MPWSKADIQKYYDSYASSYDSESSPDTYPAPVILSCWLLERLKSQPNATKSNPKAVNIIDIGCGTGQSSSVFFTQSQDSDQEQAIQFKVTGVDASANMLQVAKKYPFEALLNLDIENELTSNIQPESFDGIICVGVIDFVRDVRKLLSNFALFLIDDGHAALTLPETPNEDLNFFSVDEMKVMIEEAGFSIEKNEKIFGYVDSENRTKTYYQGFLLKKCQQSVH